MKASIPWTLQTKKICTHRLDILITWSVQRVDWIFLTTWWAKVNSGKISCNDIMFLAANFRYSVIKCFVFVALGDSFQIWEYKPKASYSISNKYRILWRLIFFISVSPMKRIPRTVNRQFPKWRTMFIAGKLWNGPFRQQSRRTQIKNLFFFSISTDCSYFYYFLRRNGDLLHRKDAL